MFDHQFLDANFVPGFQKVGALNKKVNLKDLETADYGL